MRLFYHMSKKYLANVMKIRTKINTLQNINILLFVLFTVLNKLKALWLSKAGLSNQASHSKILTAWA